MLNFNDVNLFETKRDFKIEKVHSNQENGVTYSTSHLTN